MSLKTEKKRDFSTRDIYLVATLLTMKFYNKNIDFQIEGVKNMPVGYFIFDLTDELEIVVDKFWRGEIKVEPRMFVNNLRSIRAQLTNMYKNPHNDIMEHISEQAVEKE